MGLASLPSLKKTSLHIGKRLVLPTNGSPVRSLALSSRAANASSSNLLHSSWLSPAIPSMKQLMFGCWPSPPKWTHRSLDPPFWNARGRSPSWDAAGCWLLHERCRVVSFSAVPVNGTDSSPPQWISRRLKESSRSRPPEFSMRAARSLMGGTQVPRLSTLTRPCANSAKERISSPRACPASSIRRAPTKTLSKRTCSERPLASTRARGFTDWLYMNRGPSTAHTRRWQPLGMSFETW